MAESVRTFFVVTTAGQVGPFDRAELRAALRDGTVTATDQVRSGLGTPMGMVEQVLASRSDRTSSVRTTQPLRGANHAGLIVAGAALAVGLTWLLWPSGRPIQVVGNPPEEATRPVEPPKPNVPSKPVEPPKPSVPSKPVEPPKPSVPSKPVEPPKPSVPSKPVEPPKHIPPPAAERPVVPSLPDPAASPTPQAPFFIHLHGSHDATPGVCTIQTKGKPAWQQTGPLGSQPQLRLAPSDRLEIQLAQSTQLAGFWLSTRLAWIGPQKKDRLIALRLRRDDSDFTSFRFGQIDERPVGLQFIKMQKNYSVTYSRAFDTPTAGGHLLAHLAIQRQPRQAATADIWWNAPPGPLGEPHGTLQMGDITADLLRVVVVNNNANPADSIFFMSDLRIAATYEGLGL
jgi:hypothetical protein